MKEDQLPGVSEGGVVFLSAISRATHKKCHSN